jgi:hypothetical protein
VLKSVTGTRRFLERSWVLEAVDSGYLRLSVSKDSVRITS